MGALPANQRCRYDPAKPDSGFSRTLAPQLKAQQEAYSKLMRLRGTNPAAYSPQRLGEAEFWGVRRTRVGIGALKGAGHTANDIGSLLIPDAAVRALGGHVPTREEENRVFTPQTQCRRSATVESRQRSFWLPGRSGREGVARLGELFSGDGKGILAVGKRL